MGKLDLRNCGSRLNGNDVYLTVLAPNLLSGDKAKTVHLHVNKAYGGNGDIAPLILSLCTR
jgi:hypothetical protein